MPRFGSYRRRAGRWAWRSWRGRSTYRAQTSGRRYFNISIPCETLAQATVAANSNYSNVIRTCPYYHPVGTNATQANLNIYSCALTSSSAYRAYSHLYDSVKINSVSLSISLATTIGEGGIPGIRVYTAWDRSLHWREDAISYADLIEGPEAQVVTFINNSRARLYRYNRASDLQERTQFHDCTVAFGTNQSYVDREWGSSGQMTIGYVPSMSLVLMTSDTTAADRVVPIQIQARYNVTFRNPKFGLSASSADSSGFKRDVLPEVVEEGKSTEVKDGEIVLKKKVKVEEPVYEEEVLPDDDLGMNEESSQPEMSKEEILELLRKYQEKET